MLKFCLLWLQFIEYFYEIYLLGFFFIFYRNIKAQGIKTADFYKA